MEESHLNPRLVLGLFGAILVGLLTAVVTVAAGWGLLMGLVAYTLCGSATLVGISLVLARPRSAAVPAARPADEHALA